MDISHLYHDATFGNPSLELDVKELLRTRIVNAREDRHLETLSRSYEKAKFICEKNTAWERWKVGQSLHGIYERSPHLDRSLAREKARVEELQTLIMKRGLRKRNKRLQSEPKSISPTIRSVSSTILNPINPETTGGGKRKRQRRKEKQLVKEETDGLTHSIAERHLQRQGEFARRTEHVVKSLAKLNWRQQIRRREHEQFKEELKLHSKPVIEKARVILKGRTDIDVDTMMTDFENILHSHQWVEPNVNTSHHHHHHHKHSKSWETPGTLTKGNVLQLSDDSDNRFRLSSLSTTSNSKSIPFDTKSDGKSSNGSHSHAETTSETTSTKSPQIAVNENTNNGSDKPKPDSEIVHNDKRTKNNDHVRPTQLPSLIQNNDHRTSPKMGNNSTSQTNSCHERDTVSPSSLRARNVNACHDGRRSHMGDVFSPATSVSQVIVEEEEEEEKAEEKGACNDDTKQSSTRFDDNNNSIEPKPSSSVFRHKGNDDYMMAHTTGLPQLWKASVIKKKEKVVPEVSAATIARKHKKKRNESERMW